MGVEKCCSGVHEYTEQTAEEGRYLTQFMLKLGNHDEAIHYVWESS